MATLKGSKTEENLKAAFAGESQANRRYLYFAQKADVEGYNDVASVFRSTAEGETGHAHGHLEFLESVGDPATGLPIGGDLQQSQGRRRRRDARIYGHVSGHGAYGARGRLRGDRRLVRDAGQGRALARGPLPARARRTEVSRVLPLPARREEGASPRGRLTYGNMDSRCGKAVWTPRRGIRSIGKAPTFTTKPSSTPKYGACSTFVTPAAAASTSAIVFRGCSTLSTAPRAANSTRWRARISSRSSTPARSATCVS